MVGIGGRTRWTPGELRAAPPEVLDAARWEVFADTLWPGPDHVASLYAPDEPSTKTQIQRQKVAARKELQAIREILLPPDEVSDGD